MVRIRQLSGGSSSGGCSGCLAAAGRWSWTVRTAAGQLLFAGDAPEAEAPAEFDALIAELKKSPVDTQERYVAELVDETGAMKSRYSWGGAAKPGMSTGAKVAIGLGVAGVLYLMWRRLRG